VLRGRLRNAGPKTRHKVWSAIARATVVYSSETWQISSASSRKLDRFHLRWMRRIHNLNPKFDARKGHIVYPSSEAVLAAANSASLTEIINQQRLRFLGHVLRRGEDDQVCRSFLDSIPLRGREGAVTGNSLKEQLHALVKDSGLTMNDAHCRGKWRRRIGIWLDRRTRRRNALATGQLHAPQEADAATVGG